MAQKIREYISSFIRQICALRKSAQSFLQLASLAQCFGEEPIPTHSIVFSIISQNRTGF
jgi:hypothetical protein